MKSPLAISEGAPQGRPPAEFHSATEPPHLKFSSKPLISRENKCIIKHIINLRQVSAMKKISVLIITAILFFALSLCINALYTVDGAVTNKDTAVNGNITADTQLTLDAVENLQFVKSARGSVTLSWDKVPDAYAYQVFVKYESDKKFRYNYTVKANEVTIKDIDNEGAIKFKVRGFCYDKGEVVYGKFSSAVEALTKPENVTKIYTRSITDDSITLYWDKAEGATGYRVYIYDKESGKFKVYKKTSRTTLTVSGLDKDKLYRFKVMSYKRAGNSTAFGASSSEYKEYTYNSGAMPHTLSQVAQHYNDLITTLKAEENMTVQYSKSIDTEYIGCSKNNLATTVKNTLSLFEGTLKKTYIYKNGNNDEKSSNKLIEPYSRKPALTRNDIKEYTIKEKEDGYTIKITLKSESAIYNKGETVKKSYFYGVLALPQYKSLKTTPLTIEGADSYYDGGTLSVTVKDGRVSNLNIQAAVLSDIDFSVADVKASAVICYEMKETYKIKYTAK